MVHICPVAVSLFLSAASLFPTTVQQVMLLGIQAPWVLSCCTSRAVVMMS